MPSSSGYDGYQEDQSQPTFDQFDPQQHAAPQSIDQNFAAMANNFQANDDFSSQQGANFNSAFPATVGIKEDG